MTVATFFNWMGWGNEITLVKGEQTQPRAELREDLGELRREMNERFDNMHHQMLVQTRWLIGSLALSCTVSTGR